jgi:SAM-dependent methyltransferase
MREMLPSGRVLVTMDEALSYFSSRPKAPDQDPKLDGHSFEVDLRIPQSLDPLGEPYRLAVLEQYQRFTGKKYQTESEVYPFENVETLHVRPWPYSTGDAGLVGEQLQATGFIMRNVNPKPGDKVLELGCGWGNMTLPLAQLGCDVTAIDIDEGYLGIVRRRLEINKLEARVVKSAFLEIGDLGREFDLIITCACFHHCDDHLRLLRMMRSLLKTTGRIALCGEPMDESMATPWGLNPHGGSLSYVYAFGWLELSFRVSYLMQALRATQFAPDLHVCSDTALGNVLLGRPV